MGLAHTRQPVDWLALLLEMESHLPPSNYFGIVLCDSENQEHHRGYHRTWLGKPYPTSRIAVLHTGLNHLPGRRPTPAPPAAVSIRVNKGFSILHLVVGIALL